MITIVNVLVGLIVILVSYTVLIGINLLQVKYLKKEDISKLNGENFFIMGPIAVFMMLATFVLIAMVAIMFSGMIGYSIMGGR